MFKLVCTSIADSLEVEEDLPGYWMDLNTPQEEMGEEEEIATFVMETLSTKEKGL